MPISTIYGRRRNCGVADPLYVAARAVLLDALEALGEHRSALILVGAHAVYLVAGEGDLAVAPYTTDSDVAIDPNLLRDEPSLRSAMERAGFRLENEVGRWITERNVDTRDVSIIVDLLVPAAAGGLGRRSAHLPAHGKNVARKVAGLEAALVDNVLRDIGALDEGDRRSFQIKVAGAGALVIAKAHKIADRVGDGDRLRDKDALDIYRVLREIPAEELAERVRACAASEVAGESARHALEKLQRLFGTTESEGCLMASRAAGGDATIARAVHALVAELFALLR